LNGRSALRIDVVTIFPDYLAPLSLALLGKAIDRGLVELAVHDLRNWTDDVHRTVDDAPYGGGPGMLMRAEPWWRALTELAGPCPDRDLTGPRAADDDRPLIIVPAPTGRVFSQQAAAELAGHRHLIFCCGRYEGIDSRVVDAWADQEISLGDFVVWGGEVATLTIVEAVTRLLPGAMGNVASTSDESFSAGLLEAPAYTRPETFEGRTVPAVLRSGDHGAVGRWRREQSLARTMTRRPDLSPAAPTGQEGQE
jgi:tRNA (guanine37-N1)-methyltransferase